MREVIRHCGEKPELIGIHTLTRDSTDLEPAKDPIIKDTENCGLEARAKPIVLLLNSGLLPNIGPYRLHVRLARHLSTLGFESFRFDLSGIGESERSDDNLSRSEQQMRDINIVMTHLQETCGAEQFVVMGICTGADNAHRAIMRDERIVGAIGIDGYYYPTFRYYLNYLVGYLLPQMLRLESWVSKSGKVLSRLGEKAGILKSVSSHPVTIPYRWKVPDKRQTEADFKHLISRNANMLCIYTASWPYNYPNQLADAFPSIPIGDNIQVRYFENAEHMFPLSEDRNKLTETVSSWLLERF